MSKKFDSDKAFEKVLATSLETELMPPSRACPDPGTLSAYYEGKLTESEARECERHASTCAACQRQLALLVRLEPQGVSPEVELDVAPSEPEVARWWSWRWTASAALAATAVLAIVVTYRSRPLMEEAVRLTAGERESPTSPATAAPEAREELAFGRASSLHNPRPPSASPSVSEETRADRAEAPPQNALAPPPDETLPTAPPATELPLAKASTALPPAPAAEAAAPSPPRLSAKPSPAAEAFAAKKAERSTGDQMTTRAAARASGELGTVAAYPSRRAESAPGGVTVVARSNRQVLWRLGSGGMIERSDDSGETWQSQESGVTVALLAGSAPSSEVCWVVGKGGTVLRTSDGRRWEKVSSPTGEDLVQVTALGASQATVTSSSGRRFGTDDGARTWSLR